MVNPRGRRVGLRERGRRPRAASGIGPSGKRAGFGTSWTLELHELADGAALGTIMDWISSGVPISQPEPDALARELLAERGLQLFRNSYAGPCTRSRHGIGYVCRDAELVKLASVVRHDAAETGVDPVVLASRWVAAGFSADAAGGWIREGVHSPQVAQQTVR